MKRTPSSQDWFMAMAALDPAAAWWAVDAEQKIVFWSEGATRLLGFEADEVMGKHCSFGVQCVQCASGCGLREFGRIQSKSLRHYHRDGHEVAASKSAQAIHDEKGQFLGGVEVLRQIDGPATTALPTPGVTDFYGILSGDSHFIALLTSLRRVAHTDVNVLIRGETGTGKEMVARALHQMSPRATKPFVAVNCGTLSREFLASEIFGHKRGAYTGAVADKKGLLARAEGGTLFLDEVAELSPEVQAMLLRVIQERRYTPLGDVRDLKADIRIISATHRSLRDAVAEGAFREDLMYRLRVTPIFLPRLIERGADMRLLLNHLLQKTAERMQSQPPIITDEVMTLLDNHSWPGNVRELMNLAEYLTVTRGGSEVRVEHLLPELRETSVVQPVKKSSAMPDRLAIEEATKAANGNLEEAAKRLGVSRITLWRWRKKLGL